MRRDFAHFNVVAQSRPYEVLATGYDLFYDRSLRGRHVRAGWWLGLPQEPACIPFYVAAGGPNGGLS
jgi:hypothetical protein